MTTGFFQGERTETFGEGWGVKYWLDNAPLVSPETTTVHSGPCILFGYGAAAAVLGADLKLYNALTATGDPFWLECIVGDNSRFWPPYGLKFDTGITILVPLNLKDVWVSYIPMSE